ncbi:MAG: hypothetical protein Q9222_006984 [Ikaeria aurantiellina]
MKALTEDYTNQTEGSDVIAFEDLHDDDSDDDDDDDDDDDEDFGMGNEVGNEYTPALESDGEDDVDDEPASALDDTESQVYEPPVSHMIWQDSPRELHHPSTPPNRLPFYLLHTTQHDICLFHAIPFTTAGATPPSSQSEAQETRCRMALRQLLHPHDKHLGRLTRLNMVLQIPELGIAIVADQMGRVAVLSITRHIDPTDANNDIDAGFRIERFLPLKSQEDAGLRPKTELLGVAAAPTQGREFVRGDERGGKERWRELEERPYRLLLYYRDHTTLSYELRRPRGALEGVGG